MEDCGLKNRLAYHLLLHKHDSKKESGKLPLQSTFLAQSTPPASSSSSTTNSSTSPRPTSTAAGRPH